MTTDRETTRIVRSWIQLGVDRMPERVLDAVLDELPMTPQRRSRWPAWRSIQMPKLIAAIAGVAAVLLVAVAGVRLLPNNEGVAGPAPTPSPTTSPSPTALGAADVGRVLTPGRYRVGDPFANPFSITTLPGWSLQTLSTGDGQLADTVGGNTPAWILVDLVDNVFVDTCHANAPMNPPVAKTVDAVAEAVTHMVGYTAGPTTDTTIGGHPAKTVQIVNNINTDTGGCTGGPMLSMWTFVGGGSAQTHGGTTDQLWIVDVGGTVVIIDGQSFPETTPEVRAEIPRLVNTIAFN